LRYDGPSIDATVTDGDSIKLTTKDENTDGVPTDSDTASSTANFGGAFSVGSSSYGADGMGSTAWNYTLAVTGTPVLGLVDSGMTSESAKIYLYKVGTAVVGSTATTAPATITDASVVFSLSVAPTTGVVTLTQHVW